MNSLANFPQIWIWEAQLERKGRNFILIPWVRNFLSRLSASDVRLTGEMKLGTRPGDKILVKELDLIPDFNNIDLELECLFPKDGKCCPDKFLKSCNPGLARIVLK